jgi:NAD(P)H-quinone oxidoreductase subunit 5
MLTKPQAGRIIASLVVALLLYASTGWLFGVFAEKSAAVISLGAILIMGLTLLIAESMQGRIEVRVIGRIVLAAGAASCAYFVLQKGAAALPASSLPIAPTPDSAGMAIMVLVMVSFAAVTILQILAPTRSVGRAWRIARVHLANGLYVNACFNRLVGVLRRPATSTL